MKKLSAGRKIYLVLSVFFCITMLLFVPRFFENPSAEKAGRLDNWYYTTAEGKGVDISLPHKLYQNSSGVTEIHTVLPAAFDEPQTVCFWTFYQCVQVFLDGECIYRFDNSENGSFGVSSSPRWNRVEIHTSDNAGKVLTLKFHTPYSDINTRLTEVMYGSGDSISGWLHQTYGVYRTFEIIFICVGVILLVLAAMQLMNKQDSKNQLYSGIILILFSIYLRTGTKGLPIYWLNDYFMEFLCYSSLLCLSIPFTLYLKSRVAEIKRMALFCDILVFAELTVSSVIFLLHFTGLRDIHTSMAAGLFLLLVSVITALVCDIIFIVKRCSFESVASLFSAVIILFVMAAEYVQFYQLSTMPFDTGLLSHIGCIIVVIIEMTVQAVLLKRDISEKVRIADENKNLQLQLLTSQIKPHFLLNTVGAIRTLIHENPDRASDLLYEFSKYFRKNLERQDYTKPVPFLQELDYISTYLKLECARFGDKMIVEYDMETTEFWVLPLTIQPFVENAVKHGLNGPSADPLKKGILRISSRKLEKSSVVTVEDNGTGFDAETVFANLSELPSVGMRSAVMRLEKELGATVDIQSCMTPGKSGTVITIEIPDRRIRKR